MMYSFAIEMLNTCEYTGYRSIDTLFLISFSNQPTYL